MKKILLIACAAGIMVAAANIASAGSCKVWTALGTSKFIRSEVPAKSIPVDLDAVRNEHESFQVILRSNNFVKSVSVKASDLKSGANTIDAKNVELRLASYMNLTQNVGGGFRNGYYPDALRPMPDEFALPAGQSQMVWANIYVPLDAKPGIYRGSLTLNTENETRIIPIKLRVRDLALSVENHFGSAFALWGGMAASYYGLSVESEQYKELADRYHWFMTGYRLPPDDLPVPVESPEAVKYLSDPRVTSFRIPYDPKKPDEFKKRVDYLREKGWLSKGYVYTIDEPPASEFANCAAYGREIDKTAKDVKWLLTAAPDKSLIGSVDLWCPILHAYDQKACQERQAAGDTVWWYTCIWPQHPYPTYLINDTATAPRIMSWFQSLYKVEGVLYWALNIWDKYDGTQYIKRDVWNDPLAFPGANGDGYLIYPGKTYKDDPVPTLRLEMIRQGNEDFETLYILESRYKDAARSMNLTDSDFDPHSRVADYVGKLGQSLTKWNRDAKYMETVRREMLDDIESVGRGPKILVSTSISEGTYNEPKDIKVNIYAENGTAVNVRLIKNGKSTAVPVTFGEASGKDIISSQFTVSASGEQTRLMITARKGRSTKTITRTFQITEEKPLVFKKPSIVCGWMSQADVDKWDTNGAQITLDKSKILGNCASVTFEGGVEFPNIRLMSPKGFTENDWSKKGHIAISLSNPDNSDFMFYIKATDLDGKTVDTSPINLAANCSQIFSMPVSDIAAKIDIKRLKGFEIWAWQRSTPITIKLGPVVTLNEKP